MKEKIKAWIPNGGKGSRLGEYNKKRNPKGFVLFYGRPLIAYQIEVLKKAGIDEVLISMNSEEHLERFLFYLKKGLIPNCFKYEFYLSHRPYYSLSPYEDFQSGYFRSLFRDSNIFCINSDNVFQLSDIKPLIKKIRKKPYISWATLPAKYSLRNLPFKLNGDNVEGYLDNNVRGHFAGPTYISRYDICKVSSFAKEKKYFLAQNSFIAKLLEQDSRFKVYPLKFFINMNVIEDYLQVRDLISQNSQCMLNTKDRSRIWFKFKNIFSRNRKNISTKSFNFNLNKY